MTSCQHVRDRTEQIAFRVVSRLTGGSQRVSRLQRDNTRFPLH
jgi:hypothetical protein